jgi:hypothetical protein
MCSSGIKARRPFFDELGISQTGERRISLTRGALGGNNSKEGPENWLMSSSRNHISSGVVWWGIMGSASHAVPRDDCCDRYRSRSIVSETVDVQTGRIDVSSAREAMCVVTDRN